MLVMLTSEQSARIIFTLNLHYFLNELAHFPYLELSIINYVDIKMCRPQFISCLV